MLSYFLKCPKNTESSNSRVLKTKRRTPVFLSKCAVWGSKKKQDLLKSKKLKGYY